MSLGGSIPIPFCTYLAEDTNAERRIAFCAAFKHSDAKSAVTLPLLPLLLMRSATSNRSSSSSFPLRFKYKIFPISNWRVSLSISTNESAASWTLSCTHLYLSPVHASMSISSCIKFISAGTLSQSNPFDSTYAMFFQSISKTDTRKVGPRQEAIENISWTSAGIFSILDFSNSTTFVVDTVVSAMVVTSYAHFIVPKLNVIRSSR
mmetsp:Transcript_3553/g.8096  ORF Transcript_3553/g.8096 Transcript_3553/m.8096 type:complete len:206 (+) Transcript_3553:761-1378(+)